MFFLNVFLNFQSAVDIWSSLDRVANNGRLEANISSCLSTCLPRSAGWYYNNANLASFVFVHAHPCWLPWARKKHHQLFKWQITTLQRFSPSFIVCFKGWLIQRRGTCQSAQFTTSSFGSLPYRDYQNIAPRSKFDDVCLFFLLAPRKFS